MADDERTRRERAARLWRKIDELRSGAGTKGKAASPREFLDQRAREEMGPRRSAPKGAEEEENSDP